MAVEAESVISAFPSHCSPPACAWSWRLPCFWSPLYKRRHSRERIPEMQENAEEGWLALEWAWNSGRSWMPRLFRKGKETWNLFSSHPWHYCRELENYVISPTWWSNYDFLGGEEAWQCSGLINSGSALRDQCRAHGSIWNATGSNLGQPHATCKASALPMVLSIAPAQ